MTSTLRPLSIGELLDQTFTLYRDRFVLFAGIAAIPYLALLIFQFGVERWGRPGGPVGAPGVVGPAIVVALATFIISLFALAYAAGGTVIAVADVLLGKPVGIGSALGAVRGRALAVLAAILVVGIVVIGCMAPLFISIPLVVASPLAGAVAAFVGLGGIVVAIWFWLRSGVVVPAVMLEDCGPLRGLGRSAALTAGFRGRVFLVYSLLVVLRIIISVVLGMALALAGLGAHASLLTVWAGGSPFIGFIANVVVEPILAIALALLFFDFKVRKEAFDLELLLRRAAATPGPAPV